MWCALLVTDDQIRATIHRELREAGACASGETCPLARELSNTGEQKS